jgi:hypothetical protein
MECYELLLTLMFFVSMERYPEVDETKEFTGAAVIPQFLGN